VRQPDHDTFRRFCVRAPEHVFAYWKEQWTYYSLYRNLAICVLVGSIPGVLLVSKYAGRIWTAVVAAALAAILACLYWAMRALLTLYRNIVWDVGPNRRAPASSRDR
jgi:hypothetical protein